MMENTTTSRCKVLFHDDGNDCCSLASLLQSKLTSPDSVCLVSDNARRPSDSLLEQALSVMKDFDMGIEEDDNCEDHSAARAEERSTTATLPRRRSRKVCKKQVKASSKRCGKVQPQNNTERQELAVSDLPALVPETLALTSPPNPSVQQRRMLIQVLESTMLISDGPFARLDRNRRIR